VLVEHILLLAISVLTGDEPIGKGKEIEKEGRGGEGGGGKGGEKEIGSVCLHSFLYLRA